MIKSLYVLVIVVMVIPVQAVLIQNATQTPIDIMIVQNADIHEKHFSLPWQIQRLDPKEEFIFDRFPGIINFNMMVRAASSMQYVKFTIDMGADDILTVIQRQQSYGLLCKKFEPKKVAKIITINPV
jgi:hypothetical protein